MTGEFIGEFLERDEGASPMKLPTTLDQLRAIVVTNMLRERERCAKIAELYAEGSDGAPEQIAEEIREGE